MRMNAHGDRTVRQNRHRPFIRRGQKITEITELTPT